MFELDLREVMELSKVEKTYRPIPRFPAVVRDMAIVVDMGVTHKQMLDVICGFPLVDGVALFDMYRGDQVPTGKKSLAYRVTFQSTSKTLKDEEVNAVLDKILGRLEKELGATLRG